MEPRTPFNLTSINFHVIFQDTIAYLKCQCLINLEKLRGGAGGYFRLAVHIKVSKKLKKHLKSTLKITQSSS